ncbi:GNAT family N-acetyltransferase [Curtobacterium citreum]|uniref:hypothetical protein n=1 Tax=Curtobacterium citreum TaxID=2036 RepID=UPI002ED39B4A
MVRDAAGSVVASTGYETGPDGRHVLLRSVAVGPALRGSGTGTVLAGFAMTAARSSPPCSPGRPRSSCSVRADSSGARWRGVGRSGGEAVPALRRQHPPGGPLDASKAAAGVREPPRRTLGT